ncbi:hypothetical protein LA66_14955 [Aureimonas altamirensis]|uniref:PRC-barrel domain-containing protein n=1 Tax=Aureimonas altamirensis TaxID=370622 RepID=A0A0B1Q4X7_9HYPH|nr:hypothetical protein [Aureimonas altamirensis]KHJ53885.1 hypothetical protein LA66_14955 [Aureimonas altamirensis]
MKKLAAATLVSFALLAGSASAQVVQVIELDDNVVVEPFQLTVGELERTAISDVAGTRLGDIREVIGTVADGPTALVVDLADSTAVVIVPLERFSVSNGTVTVDIGLEELAALPAYDRN